MLERFRWLKKNTPPKAPSKMPLAFFYLERGQCLKEICMIEV